MVLGLLKSGSSCAVVLGFSCIILNSLLLNLLFLEKNGVKHIRSAPYQAERFVRTFKEAMRATGATVNSVHEKLFYFLLRYQSTPHSSTGRTPASLFLQRELRTRLSLLKPSSEDRAIHAQGKEVDRKSKLIVNSQLNKELRFKGIVIARYCHSEMRSCFLFSPN